jgi:heterodisulfide reductase subunit A-like polyferredoxin
VCPVPWPDEYDQGLALRKAAFKKYAQAIPGAFAISKRGVAPCKAGCPAHISVQGYIALVAAGKYREALKLIKQENPLPSICGRVCHHPCESICTRGRLDEPVAIDPIKRFVADLDLNSETPYIPEIKEKKEEKVAVVGSGPAGLSCAYYLAIEGYQTTIFEKLPIPGGMLSVGIPEYRLPRETLNAEIRIIQEMGVDLRTGIEVGKTITIDQLRQEGYQAIFLGIGAQECKMLDIEGEDLDGVFSGIDFLKEVNLGNPVKPGDRVAVIGGGNVAFDAVRTARRLGAKEAFIIYRRSLEEMPANEEEIEECEEEGIELRTLTNPTRIIGENGRVKAIECLKMELGEPDESGRRRPVPIDGSEFHIEVDWVIPAIGQESEWSCLGPECACTLSDWGTMNVDPFTLQTDDPDIFSGGDSVTGPATVIEAIEAGKQAAISMDRFIRGVDLREGRDKHWEESQDIPTEGYDTIPRAQMPRVRPEKRLDNFREVQLGLDEAQTVAEAKRCVACGICSECYECVGVCDAEAVTLETHSEQPETINLEVGALILAPGFQAFDPSKYKTYGYSNHPNIITSMEFERLLSASGPTMGHLVRPSDEREPKKIAWVQCVGSRDIHKCDHSYCSSVCCMAAIKEAVVAKEHAGDDLDCAIFFIDMRTHGKDFERYYDVAREQKGVRFIRSRVPTVETLEDGDLLIPYVNDKGEIVRETFDLVVLSVGLETSPETIELAKNLEIDLTSSQFSKTDSFHPVATSREGIYVCGTFQGPKDIPQSVIEASSAAAEAGALLSNARHTLTREEVVPEERNIRGERPRVGVFVCECGINISGVVDVPAVRDFAASLPYVEYVTDNLYTCSQDTQETMARVIKEQGLNRVVVAACTPKTHEPLFRETLVKAGLNKYLFEMTNIRNQNSWVHKETPHVATEKAKDLVSMSVAKVALMESLEETTVPIHQDALVVGGGISGMVAAKNLSDQGYRVSLVEREPGLGGQALQLFKTWQGEDIQHHLSELIEAVETAPNIELHLETEIAAIEGFVGNFKTTLSSGGQEKGVEHGIVVLATGADELKPDEYLYGKDPRVVTHLELDRMFMKGDTSLRELKNAVFIQCVGSREPERPYCSRVCCTHAIKSALRLKKQNPDMNVYVLYRDIRTYGERETLYRDARLAGVLFIRFSLDQKPSVINDEDGLKVEVMDPILEEMVEIKTDILTLASVIVPYREEKLAQSLKVPMNEDGFFVEAHAKLGPSEFATDGVFLCGMAHYPKSIDESVAQALAASSRAATLLAKKSIQVSGTLAEVDPFICSECGVCVEVCPYSAAELTEKGPSAGRAEVNEALCKGCGLCVASCRSGAINLKGFGREQILAMINEV